MVSSHSPNELPRLIVITDWGIPELRERLEPVLSLGPEVGIQHRHPGAADRAFLEEGRSLAALCRRSGNPLFVNGRLDVALLLAAHLHLPARGVSISDVRPHLSPGSWVSIAVHDPVEAAATDGATLALLSPVYRPGSKPADARAPLGPDGFEKLATTLSCPAFALGGISPGNAERVRGAAGFAVISSVLRASDPRAAAASLLRIAADRPH